MTRLSDGDGRDAVREMRLRLEAAGYEVSQVIAERGWLAVKRGHSLGLFLPYTDFIFLHDLDSESIDSARELDALHERHREYGEGQMRVPRPLRYRVPNTVTVGFSAGEIPVEMREVALRDRHAVNSGEKNSVWLVELGSGRVYSQGFERDPLRYGGTWVTTVNPSNRVAVLLTQMLAEASGAADGAQ